MMPARGRHVSGRFNVRRLIMRRCGLLLSLVAVMLLGIAAPGMHPVARAQGVTPVPGIEPEG
jgi:hypothetical protein